MTFSRLIALSCAPVALITPCLAQEALLAGHGDQMCRGGAWNQPYSYENPAGTRVLIRAYPVGFVDNNSADPSLVDQIHLRVLSLDSSGNPVPNSNVFVCSDTMGNGHGQQAFFIDNDSIMYRSSGGGNAFRIRTTNGTVEHTDNSAGGSPRDWCAERNEALIASWGSGDIRAFNVVSKTYRGVASFAGFESFKNQLGGSDNIADWSWSHMYWSPSGNKIFVMLKTASNSDEYFFVMDATGSNKVYVGARGSVKLMHTTMWSDTELFGANENSGTNHNIVSYTVSTDVRTLRGGTGNHIAFSPNKARVAGESWYGSNPVKLFVYNVGNSTPTHTLINAALWSYTGTKAGHWFHVDPSFSHNNSAIYYNKPVTVSGVRKCYLARYKF